MPFIKCEKKEIPQNKLLFLYVLIDACRCREKVRKEDQHQTKDSGSLAVVGKWNRGGGLVTPFTVRMCLCI